MGIFKLIKKLICPESMPIDVRLADWITSNFKGCVSIHDASTGSKYYTVTCNDISTKVRIANHTEVFDSCHLYVQTITNNDGFVLIREKKSRQAGLYDFDGAVAYICKYINSRAAFEPIPVKPSVADTAAKPEKTIANIQQPADNEIPVVRPKATVLYKAISNDHRFSTPGKIKNKWDGFVTWYGSIINIGIAKLPSQYQNKLMLLFTGTVAYNDVHRDMVNELHRTNNVCAAIDALMSMRKVESLNGNMLIDSSLPLLPPVMPSAKKVNSYFPAIKAHIANNNWIAAVNTFQNNICNIGYKDFSDRDKEKFIKVFSVKCMPFNTLYGILLHFYNMHQGKCISVILDETVKCIGNPLDIYSHSGLASAAYMKYRAFEDKFRDSVFFTSLTAYNDYWNDIAYRRSNIICWKGIMAMMFPWVNDMPKGYENHFNTYCGYGNSAYRIIEVLMIAHTRNAGASCSAIIDSATDIIADKEYDCVHWDFENGCETDDTLVKATIQTESGHETVAEKTVKKDNFFAGLAEYNEYWDCPAYRFKYLDKWREMMSGMFPWFLKEYAHMPRYDKLSQLNVSNKRIIEGLLMVHADSPHIAKHNVIVQAIKLLHNENEYQYQWDFESNAIKYTGGPTDSPLVREYVQKHTNAKVGPDEYTEFFTGMHDYYSLYDSLEYRDKHFNEWSLMMKKMFPWVNIGFAYAGGLHVLSKMDITTKTIIDVLVKAYETHYDGTLQEIIGNAIKQARDMVKANGTNDNKKAVSVINDIALSRVNEPFIYHKQPEKEMVYDIALDDFNTRLDNMQLLKESLTRDIPVYGKVSPKIQAEIISVFSYDVTYKDAVTEINKNSRLTKMIKSAVNRIKNEYKLVA